MRMKQVEELVLQSLEHELGGVKVYTMALECAVNDELREDWRRYLEETQSHVSALETICSAMKIDVARETPGRSVVRHNGAGLVAAMKMALKAGDRAAAELVACECVVLAETKDHADWELLGTCAEYLSGHAAAALQSAYDEIEDQEDEHLYHTKGPRTNKTSGQVFK